MSPEALTVPEVAALLQISEWKVYQLVKDGRITGVKRFGRSIRIPKVWLDGFLASPCETLDAYATSLDSMTLVS